nr:MAG TPA: hypothetical protein [Caudoviricetes sp.]
MVEENDSLETMPPALSFCAALFKVLIILEAIVTDYSETATKSSLHPDPSANTYCNALKEPSSASFICSPMSAIACSI